MDFLVLGPLEARHEGRPVAVARRRQERLLLTLLLLRHGRPVPTATLLDALWPDAQPATARGTLHTHVGRLRAALRPYGIGLHHRHSGYAVALAGAGHTVDADEFAALVQQADAAKAPLERIRLYDAALALWRGPLAGGPDAERLTDARLAAVEKRAEACLDAGEHAGLADDLAGFAAEHPTRERLVAARMTALYRCGRTAEALAAFRSTRDLLTAEYGTEPSADLQSLCDQIRRGDRRLDAPETPVYAVRVRGVLLPWDTSGHPALEFCNTYAGWGGPRLPGGEWLRGYRSLAAWAFHLGLAEEWVVTRLLKDASVHPDEAAAALEEAREFRSALYACFCEPDDARAFKAVTGVIETANRLAVFERDSDRLGRWRIPPGSAGLRLPLYAAARSAADLLADPRRLTIRRCPNPACGWLFLDATGLRRWCSLATCGRATPCP